MKLPTTWIRIFDATGGQTEIEYSEQIESKLRDLLAVPRAERTEMLELPFSEDVESAYVLHASDFVSFFISTLTQRFAYRELERAKQAELREYCTLHPDYDA